MITLVLGEPYQLEQTVRALTNLIILMCPLDKHAQTFREGGLAPDTLCESRNRGPRRQAVQDQGGDLEARDGRRTQCVHLPCSYRHRLTLLLRLRQRMGPRARSTWRASGLL